MGLLQDVRFAFRMLRKSPGFTAVVVGVLALGIGANTTIFTLVNAVLFRALPFEDGHRIMYITSANPKRGERNTGVSYPDFRDWKTQARSFSEMAAFSTFGAGLADTVSTPDRYMGCKLTANSFGLIRKTPLLGRDFRPEDEQAGATPVAILGYGVWKNRYGGKADIVGQVVRINDVATTVIGVMPQDFRFPVNHDLWIPLKPGPDSEKRNRRELSVFARLRDGVNVAEARAEIDLAGRQLAKSYPDTNEGIEPVLKTFNEEFNGGEIRKLFLTMLGAVGFVLLIACANVANLLLSRAVARTKEVSIRVALGASRGRVIRQLLIESILLGSVSGAFGLLVATVGVRAFDAAVAAVGKPYWIKFTMDLPVFGYVAGICLLTGIIFGLVPALHATKVDINERLKESGRTSSAAGRTRYMASAFVVAEMALAVVLMVGAGLLVRSLINVNTLTAGTADPNSILLMRLNLMRERFPDAKARWTFYENLLPKLKEAPGVEAVALASNPPIGGSYTWKFDLDGQTAPEPDKRPKTGGVIVTPEYFGVTGIALLRGRTFTVEDGLPGRTVAIVNERFARKYWKEADPIGRRLRIAQDDKTEQPWLTVVGLVPDTRQNDPAKEMDPVIYVPLRQDPAFFATVLAKTSVPPGTLSGALRRAIASVDQDMPAFGVQTLREFWNQQRWVYRVFGTVFIIFSVFALALSAVGMYSVVAYSVSQRTQEIGVRVALGASSSSVIQMVLRQGVLELAIGLAAGMAGAVGVTRVLSALLVGISPRDPVTFAGVGLVLGMSALLACLIPARRAARIDPVIALRYE